ncbi:MAG: ATP-binding protein [bacterium]
MRFTIYKKLLLGFTIIILLMMVANAYVLWQLDSVTKTTSLTFRNDVRSINLVKQMQTILYDEERYAQKFFISRDTAYLALYAEQEAIFSRYADSLYDASPNNEELKLIERLNHAHTWTKNKIRHESRSAQPLSKTELEVQDQERTDSLEVLYSSLNNLIRFNEDDVSNSVSGINGAMVRSVNVAWLITVGALLVALCVALFITGTIVRPIRTLIQGTENIARGVFDKIEVSSRAEVAWLADAVNAMSVKLKQINDLKTEMMHHISHELRTPLQTMLSAQYLLLDQKRGTLTPDQIRLVMSIKEGIRKLTHFSNQFLDIQKIEHGSMEYHFKRSKTEQIVTPLVEDTQLVASQKEVTVNYSSDSALPDVMLDVEKFSQVVSNLLSNAVKYTESGGTITIRISQTKKGIKLSVADTGAGIPKDDLPRIFTKFYQARNAKKGTGIGLALVKALVEGHKGRVYVESELDKGTTFSIELPAAPAQERSTQEIMPVEEGTT